MSEQLKYIVAELGTDPYNKSYNLISFDALEPIQLLQILTDVLSEIDSKVGLWKLLTIPVVAPIFRTPVHSSKQDESVKCHRLVLADCLRSCLLRGCSHTPSAFGSAPGLCRICVLFGGTPEWLFGQKFLQLELSCCVVDLWDCSWRWRCNGGRFACSLLFQQKVDVREEAADQTVVRLLGVLKILKYKPPEGSNGYEIWSDFSKNSSGKLFACSNRNAEQNNTTIFVSCSSQFRQGLVQGDKPVIYPILEWLLKNTESLKKRAYLARYLVKVEVPAEFLAEEAIGDLYQQVLTKFGACHPRFQSKQESFFLEYMQIYLHLTVWSIDWRIQSGAQRCGSFAVQRFQHDWHQEGHRVNGGREGAACEESGETQEEGTFCKVWLLGFGFSPTAGLFLERSVFRGPRSEI